jgi:hypothetical protein
MDIRQLLGEVREKEEYKHVHIKSGHLLKIRVIMNFVACTRKGGCLDAHILQYRIIEGHSLDF